MKHYSFLEEKHNRLWKFFFGRAERDRLRGMRRVADELNREIGHKSIEGVTNPIRSSEFLKGGRVKRYFRDQIVHQPYESGLGKNAMYHPGWTEKRNVRLISEPSNSQLRQIGRGEIKPTFVDKQYTNIDELRSKLRGQGYSIDEINEIIRTGVEPSRGGFGLSTFANGGGMGLGLGY